MQLKLLIYVLLFFPLGAMAQQDLLEGSIIDAMSRNRVALAQITNLRTKATVGSNDLGHFQILGKLGDTLLIQKYNYKPINWVYTTKKDVLIRMTAEVNQIDQVNIVRSTRKGDLEALKQEFKNKGSYYMGKPPLALLSPFNGSPLTFFYELFGKTPRNARRFSRYYDSEMKYLAIEEHFNARLIKEHTQLEGTALEDFMVAFKPEYDAVLRWTAYDAITYIKKSFLKYTENPALYKNKLQTGIK